MSDGSVGCVIQQQKPALTFGSGVYPWEIKVLSVQSEKVSLSFGFAMALSTGFAIVHLVVRWSCQLYWRPIPETDGEETLPRSWPAARRSRREPLTTVGPD
jgi:hypothetical protein